MNGQKILACFVLVSVFFLVACGGGQQPSEVFQISGTAATGMAISGSTINAKCYKGAASTTTSANGAYSLAVEGIPPCVLQLINPADGSKLHSVTSNTDTTVVNITPLTELLAARLLRNDPNVFFSAFDAATLASSATPAAMASAISDVTMVLGSKVDVGNIGDFVASPLIAATSGNPDTGNEQDKVLDMLKVNFSSAQLAQIAARLSSAEDVNVTKQMISEWFPAVSVAKWLGNAPSALSFVWDDTNSQHYDIIGPMFEKYGYRTSFAVVTSMFIRTPEYVTGYKSVLDHGHELCSHTHNHARLNAVGITEEAIRYELSTSKNTIINLFGKSPRCFAYPGNGFIKDMEFSSDYYLWTRTNNLNQDPENFIANIVTATGLPRFMYIYSLNANSKNWVTFAGHGVDGGSYEPISSKDLDDFLSYLKNQPVWIDTESNVALYNEIRRLISIESIAGLSIAIDDSKIDYGRYSAFGISSIPITVIISSSRQLDFSGANVLNVKQEGSDYIVTVDLVKGNKINWNFSGQ